MMAEFEMAPAARPAPRLSRASQGLTGDADKALRILTGWQLADFRGYAVAEKRADRRLVAVALSAALAAQNLSVPCVLIAPDEIAAEQWQRHLGADDPAMTSGWSITTPDGLLADDKRLDGRVVVVADEIESYLDEAVAATIGKARGILGLCASPSALSSTSLRRIVGGALDISHAATAMDLEPLAAVAPLQEADVDAGEAREQLVTADDPEDLLGLYLRQVQKIPLLSAADEIHLAKQIEAGVFAEAALAARQASRSGIPRASSDPRMQQQIDKDLQTVVALGRAAKELFVVSNLRLVFWIARRYAGRMELLDAIQDGTLGLIRAVEKFDHRQGNKFSTYATWWVRQAISRALADQALFIRLPVHVHESDAPVLREARRLKLAGLGATPDDIASVLALDADQVRLVLRRHAPPVSLEQIVAEGEDIEDPFAPDPHEAAVRTLREEALDDLLRTLSERDARILRLRYGLDDGKEKTLDEIGRLYSLTRERIRQIEGKSVGLLRSQAPREYFEGSLDPN